MVGGGGVGGVVVVDLEKKERKRRIVIYNPCQSPPFLATLFFQFLMTSLIVVYLYKRSLSEE